MSAVPVFADANPNNHGHHYGQLKHPKHPPVATPTPTAASNPAATPLPTNSPGIVTSPGPGAGAGAAAKAVTSPKPDIKTPLAPVAFRTPVPNDPWWWLLLAILPTLVAVWLIVFRRIVLGAPGRLRSNPKGAVAPAEA